MYRGMCRLLREKGREVGRAFLCLLQLLLILVYFRRLWPATVDYHLFLFYSISQLERLVVLNHLILFPSSAPLTSGHDLILALDTNEDLEAHVYTPYHTIRLPRKHPPPLQKYPP